MKDAKWENVIILFIGLWTFSIPWTVGWGFGSNDINVVMWNFLTVGGVTVLTSVIAIRQLKVWPEWLSLFMGVWLIFSPLLLVYFDNKFLLWNSIISGILITGLSALSIPIAEKKRVYHKIVKNDSVLKH